MTNSNIKSKIYGLVNYEYIFESIMQLKYQYKILKMGVNTYYFVLIYSIDYTCNDHNNQMFDNVFDE